MRASWNGARQHTRAAPMSSAHFIEQLQPSQPKTPFYNVHLSSSSSKASCSFLATRGSRYVYRIVFHHIRLRLIPSILPSITYIGNCSIPTGCLCFPSIRLSRCCHQRVAIQGCMGSAELRAESGVGGFESQLSSICQFKSKFQTWC